MRIIASMGKPIVIKSVQRPYCSATLHQGSQSLPPVSLPQIRVHHQQVNTEFATFQSLHFSGMLLIRIIFSDEIIKIPTIPEVRRTYLSRFFDKTYNNDLTEVI